MVLILQAKWKRKPSKVKENKQVEDGGQGYCQQIQYSKKRVW